MRSEHGSGIVIAIGWLFAVGLGLGSASAQTAAQQTAYLQGDYVRAASMAEAGANANDLAFAARAVLADVMVIGRQPTSAQLDRAEALSRAALAKSPDHVEGQLQLAIVLSLRARPMKTGEAMRSGYGEEARDLARNVVRIDPENPWGHGFLAVWNVEVVRRGGSFGAGFIGASLKSGASHFAAARKAAPDDIAIIWQYARALVALDARKYGKEGAALFDQIARLEARDPLERALKTRASVLADTLKADPARAEAMAADWL
jgi:hypothetical protein